MFDPELLRKELMQDEGFKLESYQDTVGLWTIGVGHLLGKERRMLKITLREAIALLDCDILDAEEALDRSIPFWKRLDDVRQRALMNMSFNLGARLAGFTKFKQSLAVANWTEARTQMLDSRWAEQVHARAIRLADMIEKGV